MSEGNTNDGFSLLRADRIFKNKGGRGRGKGGAVESGEIAVGDASGEVAGSEGKGGKGGKGGKKGKGKRKPGPGAKSASNSALIPQSQAGKRNKGGGKKLQKMSD